MDISKLKLGRSDGRSETPGYLVRDGKFLRGPIPLEWLSRAANAPGKALHVAVAIWHRRFLTKSLTVDLNLSRLSTFGLTRDAARRGLQALEEEGLVVAQRVQGRKAQVTIVVGPRTTDRQ
jgi:hypothetical protein